MARELNYFLKHCQMFGLYNIVFVINTVHILEMRKVRL